MPVFRKGFIEDIEQIADLEARIFSDAWTSRSLQDTFAQKHAFITVAEHDGFVVGYCIIYHVLDEGEIARIAVSSGLRDRGIGKGLLDYTCECCREKQVERLLLDVRESNITARTFYEKYGFDTDGIRKNFYEMPKEDAVLMSFQLK